jgi:hypothetical protein
LFLQSFVDGAKAANNQSTAAMDAATPRPLRVPDRHPRKPKAKHTMPVRIHLFPLHMPLI